MARYSVLLPDGTRHPSADLPTLNAWAAEGRITPDTLLAPEGSNATLAARTIPGLIFPATTPRRSQMEKGMSSELRSAWLCAAISIFGGLIPCFGRLSGAGALAGLLIVLMIRGRGEPGTFLAFLANLVGLAIAIGWAVFLWRLVG